MKVISIVDDDYGIMFNNRRVSKDSMLNDHIIKMLDGREVMAFFYIVSSFLVIMKILRLIRSLVLLERTISVLLRTLRLFLMRIWWMRFICISGTGSILLM